MTERLIIVSADSGYLDTITAVAEQAGALDCRVYALDGDTPRKSVHLVVDIDSRQAILDKLQSIFTTAEDWRITILPVEASIPRPKEEDGASRPGAKKSRGESREELYNDVARSARLDANFLVFAALATVVAAIGLIEDNVAVVIGAMVIAPLLGPNLAFCLGVALGDQALMGRAIATSAAGLALSVVLCAVIGIVWPLDLRSTELMARTEVGFDSMALALASGAAAALSLTAGLSSTLVGVMVAVALLPPAAAIGLMMGAQHWSLALGAALLLAVNIVCVNLSAQVVFVSRGMRPRTRFEKEAARRAVAVNAAVWCLLLAALAVLLYVRAPKLS